jgi:outer membrane receptor protein involved in Fe transport
MTLMLLTTGDLWAGVTGKLTGVVQDAKTGEPIANVNVVISRTDFGAATLKEGDYLILNITPGRYSVTASSVGYVSVTQSDVMIYADLTTRLDFQLQATVIQGQEVVVKSKRKVLRQDVTASTRISTGEEMYGMPVANFVGAVANIGGAVGTGNNIHIRGGRRGEVAYLIDGMEVKDPILNQRMLSIGNPAVAEMIALTGGFDAEYGNAQSAVVNVVTREGSKEYHGKLRYVCDDPNEKPKSKYENHINDFSPVQPGRGFPDTTLWSPPVSYGNYDYFEGSIGGPEPITTYLFPQLGLKIPGYMTVFVSADLTGRNTNSNGVRINSSEWYRHDLFGGVGPETRREQNYLNSSYQLTYSINPTMKLKAAYRFNRTWANIFLFRQSRFFPYDYTQSEINDALNGWTGNTGLTYVSGVDDDGDGRIDEEALNGRDDDLDGTIDEDLQWYEYNAPDHLPTRYIDDEQFLLSWSHTLSKTTFYSVKLSRYLASRVQNGSNKEPWEYGEYGETFTDLPGPDGKKNGNYDVGEPFVDKDGDGIWDRGNQANNYYAHRGFLIAGDGTEDDIGQPVPYWLKEKSYVYGLKAQITNQVHKNHQIRAGFDFNYFDLYNKSLPYPTIDNNGTGIYTDIYHVYPSDGAIYGQDKMEFKDITLTAGGRFDFYMPGDQVQNVMAFDSSNADWNPNYVPFDVPEKIKVQFSPRIGASFSITENAYLHAHYGHFYQRPRWDNVFTSVNQPQTGGTPLIGNPDLDPEKTVAFEVGVAWNLYQDYLLDVTGFLKDVKNWINAREGKYWYPERFGKPLIGQNFAIYDNQDYAFARGIEFNFSREYGTNISGRITYTLSWVNAKNSYDIGTQGIRRNYTEPVQALPAGWDQRHSIVLDYGMNYGPTEPFLGIKGMPGDVSINLLWNLRSGLPYSPTDASGTKLEGRYMSKRTPWTKSADLNITKYYTIGKYRPSVWFQIFNLFDRENLLNVDDNYGRAGEPNAFDDYTGRAGWVNDTSSPNYSQVRYAGPNPDAFDNPRVFRLGLGLEF